MRFSEISSCIDAGNNQAVPNAVDFDLEANLIFKNGTLDIGAYEFLNSAIENEEKSNV